MPQPKPKRSLFFRLLMHSAVYLGIIVLLILGVNLYLHIYTNHGQSLTVPDFSGMSMDQVQSICESKGLRYTVKDSTYEPGKAKLTILEQNPRAYAKVKENRRIYLTINTDRPPKVSLPNVKDVNFKAASRILETYGFKVGQLEYEPDIALNAVLKTKYNGQTIEAGSLVDKGSVIDLVLGDGARGEKTEVPLLNGLTVEESILVLRGNYLVLGRVIAQDGLVIDSSTFVVYRQEPSPPRVVSPGEPVNIHVTTRVRYDDAGQGLD